MKNRLNNSSQERSQSTIKTWGKVMFIFFTLLFTMNLISAFNWDDPDLHHYYNFDDKDANFLTDKVNNSNGTMVGSPLNASGIIGDALNFSGANMNVNMSQSILSAQGTISVWAYINRGNGDWLLGNDDSGDNDNDFYIILKTAGTQVIWTNGAAQIIITSNDTTTAATWTHFVVVWGTGGLRFYQDGVIVGNDAETDGVDLTKWLLGGAEGSDAGNGPNAMDELGIWSRRLSESEVGELYNGGAGLEYVRPEIIDITLTTPSNGVTLAGNTYFNATYNSSGNGFELINSTYYIWYSNGTVFNNSYTIPITGINNITNASFSFDTFGEYKWNVFACNGDGFPTNCTMDEDNRTFSFGAFSVDAEAFKTPVLEGTSQIFTLNITKGSSLDISYVTLVYNGTATNGTFSLISGNQYTMTETIIIPSVTTATDRDFFWNVTFAGGLVHSSTTQTQTVNNLGLDDCSVHTIQILNFTLSNEDTKINLTEDIDNTTIEIDLDFYSTFGGTTPIIEFSQLYSQTLPARVCISNALANSTFYMDAQVFYKAVGFSEEYYNIQRYNLNGSSGTSRNITLYDLNKSIAQAFKISFKDSSFLPVEGALIQIERKYVSDGISRIVEIPITDANGEAIGNLVRNDVIYSFTVTRNGETLGVFKNVLAICQNPAITECKISLNSFSSNINVKDFYSILDFDYTLTWNNETRTISTTFSIPSGVPSLIVLNVSKEDALGTDICTSSLTSSSGTINCVVGSGFGNTTVLAQIYKDGELIGFGQVKLDQDPRQIYGGALMFLGLILMLTLIGAGVSDNPIYTTVFLMIGVIMLFALNLVANNGFIGGSATILWLFIAMILVIIKGSNRN